MKKNKRNSATFEEVFPDIWKTIYVIYLLRLIYEPKFKRLKTHYQYSILSEIYPYVNLSHASMERTLIEIGKRKSAVRDFMKEDLLKEDIYLLIY